MKKENRKSSALRVSSRDGRLTTPMSSSLLRRNSSIRLSSSARRSLPRMSDPVLKLLTKSSSLRFSSTGQRYTRILTAAEREKEKFKKMKRENYELKRKEYLTLKSLRRTVSERQENLHWGETLNLSQGEGSLLRRIFDSRYNTEDNIGFSVEKDMNMADFIRLIPDSEDVADVFPVEVSEFANAVVSNIRNHRQILGFLPKKPVKYVVITLKEELLSGKNELMRCYIACLSTGYYYYYLPCVWGSPETEERKALYATEKPAVSRRCVVDYGSPKKVWRLHLVHA